MSLWTHSGVPMEDNIDLHVLQSRLIFAQEDAGDDFLGKCQRAQAAASIPVLEKQITQMEQK
ncbi:MAG: hypothetical protein JWN37_714 [Candidatus Nomurabacteria bacterium]|nr:hypothetical protein [Candidatus Nomurabacteria bacterium]